MMLQWRDDGLYATQKEAQQAVRIYLDDQEAKEGVDFETRRVSISPERWDFWIIEKWKR
jgi:hypothetical protein